MKIEPCPVCGAEIEYYNDHDGMLGCVSCDYGLVYLDEQSITMHNHLSRIVRAAEEYHRIRSLSLMSGHLYNDPLDRQAERRAIRAIFDAVEGGVE